MSNNNAFTISSSTHC